MRPVTDGMAAEKVQVQRAVFRGVEDRLAVVAALRDVMRNSWND
jgi:hypothetical protein